MRHRESHGGAAVALVFALLLAGVLWYGSAPPSSSDPVIGGGGGGGDPPPPQGPPPGNNSTPSTSSLAFLAYNEAQVQVLVNDSSLLRAGDWFYLSTGNFGATPSVADLNLWADQIAAADPGAIFVAHTGGLANARALANGGLSSRFSALSLDLEPSEPGFNSAQSAVLLAIQTLTGIAHVAGLESIAYLSGQGFRYGWNYATLQTAADLVTVETQGSEGVAGGNGPALVDTLAGEYAAQQLPVDTLSVQATVGSLADGTTVTLAEVMATLNESLRVGLGPFFLEFTGATAASLVAVLQADGR